MFVIRICFFDKDAEKSESIKALGLKMQRKGCTVSLNMPENVFFDTLSTEHSVLIFLDTRYMCVGESFAFARRIREYSDTAHIVFMSSQPEDMSFCFKNLIRPSGFLLKPVCEAELSEIVFSVLDRIAQRSAARISISTHTVKRTLSLKDILYFSTVGKKLLLRTQDGEEVIFYGTMKGLEEKYAADFIRCHSGFLANRSYILGIRSGMLQLRNCRECLPISKKYRHTVTEFLKTEA